MTHLVIALANLLDEADRLSHQCMVATQRQRTASPPDLEPLKTAYIRWADAGKQLLPSDLAERWAAAMIVDRRGVNLVQVLKGAPPESLPRSVTLPSLISTVLTQQCDLLTLARLRAWPPASRIPDDRRHTIASFLATLSRWVGDIGAFFKQNGADPAWRTRPRKPDPTPGIDAVLGWLDGILVATPELEVPLVQAVLADMSRHPKVPQEQQDKARTIHDHLRLDSEKGQVPLADADLATELAAARQELAELQTRMDALQAQMTTLEARLGSGS
jgi:hypothetical protein